MVMLMVDARKTNGPSQTNGASPLMPSADEKALLKVATAAIPRVAEIIGSFAADDQAGALDVARRRFLAAALDYGCTEIAAQSRVSTLMRRQRSRLARQQASEKKLQALLHRLTEQD
jgi:hypothetical protein